MFDTKPARSRPVGALLLGLAAACASQGTKPPRMPFHVAVVTPAVQSDERAAQPVRGAPIGSELTIDPERLAARLTERLADSFVQVTPLPLVLVDAGAVARAAADAGADLVLATEVSFATAIGSSLNARFWPNLALFALGGPFGWFVPDRSYYCTVRARGALLDVSALASAEGTAHDASVCEVHRTAGEAALNFLDRADGVASFLLSCLVPAGLLSTDNPTVQATLRDELIRQISGELAAALSDQAGAIARWQQVAFSLPRIAIVRTGADRSVVGEIWMDRDHRVRELAETPLRYRFGTGSYRIGQASARAPDPAADAQTTRTIYDFRIDVPADYRGPLQLEITQADAQSTKRTFTLLVD